jgi:hypothetical protein
VRDTAKPDNRDDPNNLDDPDNVDLHFRSIAVEAVASATLARS